MNLHNIKYFLAIVEKNSISQAAISLHISQQSLSEKLQKMEHEVGATLIRRTRPIQLTQEGQVFLRAAKDMLHTYHNMLDEIADISGKSSTRITLAIPTTDTPPFLAGLLTKFSSEYPEYEVKIVQCRPKDAADCAEDFDLYFSTLPLGSGLTNIPILEGGTYAVAFSLQLATQVYAERWPEVEAKLLKEKSISALRDMPFILLRNVVDNVVLDQQIIFEEAGFIPNIAFQSINSELNSNMCKSGVGAYVATMDTCRRRFCNSDDMLIYPLDTAITPVMVALSHRKGMCITKAVSRFIEVAKKYLQNTQTLSQA